MSPEQREFHLEEYRQIRSEVVGHIARIESLFRYSIVVAATVSAWLASNSLGLVDSPSHICLKLPTRLLLIGWLISPVFIGGAGAMAALTNRRVREMGAYLKQLECELGKAEFGWERFLVNRPSILAPMAERLWYALFVVSGAAAGIALALSYSARSACPLAG